MKRYNNTDYITKHHRSRFNNKYHTSPQQSQPSLQSPLPSQLPIQPPLAKESMLSNIAGSVIQGIALGTGSQLASRGIDAIMGSRKIEIIDKTIDDNCNPEKEIYMKCINNSNDNDTTQCKYLFELLNKCKNI